MVPRHGAQTVDLATGARVSTLHLNCSPQGNHKCRATISTSPRKEILSHYVETEYGNNSNGPLPLPCDVDLFCKVLVEMAANNAPQLGWGFAYGSCSPFNTRHCVHGTQYMGKGYGSYAALTPSSLIKMN
ncbi:hypothetical protein Tco_0074192 [Tanacetum coccineum]